MTSFMNLNYLKLNIDKTNVSFLAKPRILNNYLINMDIGFQKFTSNNNNKLKILGVTINRRWPCRDIMQRCLRSYHFYLFKLRSIRHYLDRCGKIKLVLSHILSRIDYCNILYIPLCKLRRH